MVTLQVLIKGLRATSCGKSFRGGSSSHPFFVKIDFITKYIDTFLPEWVTIRYDKCARRLPAGNTPCKPVKTAHRKYLI